MELSGFADLTRLDEGGFGSVFRATRLSTGGSVAIKVLDQVTDVDAPTLQRRVDREISALVALKGHPNVVQVEEVIVTERGPGIVMEFMDRGSALPGVDDALLPAEDVALVGSSVAAALVAAHDAGIVHRDVKPRNVLTNSFGQIKLCDFGIAALHTSRYQHTRTASLSLHYASPEELDEAEDIGPPTDVYSLGATLHHLLHGAPPSFRSMRSGGPPPTPQTSPGRTRMDLLELCGRCLATDPTARPTARDVADELDALSATGVADTMPKLPVDRTVPRRELPPPDATVVRPRGTPLDTPSTDPPVDARPGDGDRTTPSGLPRTFDQEWWRR